MKKLCKRLIAIVVCCVMLYNGIISAYANNDELCKIENAIEYIQEKGFMVGDVISSSIIENGVVLNVQYLPSGETSQLKYIEKSNEKIIHIIEGDKINIIEFRNNGEIYTDNVRDYGLEKAKNNRSIIPYSYAVSIFEDTLPPGCTDKFSLESTREDYVTSATRIASCTVGYLAGLLVSAFSIDQVSNAMLSIAASALIDKAINNYINTKEISYVAYFYEHQNNKPNGMQYYYKEHIIYSLKPGTSDDVDKIIYKAEDLI